MEINLLVYSWKQPKVQIRHIYLFLPLFWLPLSVSKTRHKKIVNEYYGHSRHALYPNEVLV